VLAGEIGRLITGTTTSNGNAGGTTLVCSSLCAEPIYPGRGDCLIFKSGAYAYDGNEANRYRVVSFDDDTGTVTFQPATGGSIASGTTFEIYREIDVLILNNAINQAIRYAWQPGGTTIAKIVEDTTTITLEANTFEYDLPTECVGVMTVMVRPSESSPLIPLGNWHVFGNYHEKKLIFTDANTVNDNVGCTVYLWYQQRYTELSSETDTTDIPYYVVPMAAAQIFHSLLSNSVSDEEIATNNAMYQHWIAIAENARRVHGSKITGSVIQYAFSDATEILR